MEMATKKASSFKTIHHEIDILDSVNLVTLENNEIKEMMHRVNAVQRALYAELNKRTKTKAVD